MDYVFMFRLLATLNYFPPSHSMSFFTPLFRLRLPIRCFILALNMASRALFWTNSIENIQEALLPFTYIQIIQTVRDIYDSMI